MRKEYDFTKGVRGKFTVPIAEIRLPIYLEPKVQSFVTSAAKKKKQDTSKFVNSLLKREMQDLRKAK